MTDSYIQRRLDLSKTLSRRSVLLLGPRQVGKSSLMKNQLQDQIRLSFNLLDRRFSLEASVNPMWM
jgi:predicted AAA+ superfamily ATPase